MLPGPPPVSRCSVCTSVLSQFNLLSGLMGVTPTSIQCNMGFNCTCALPITPRNLESPTASILVAHTKDDIRKLMNDRPNHATCLLVPSRATTGLRHTLLKSSTVIHTFTSDSPVGLTMNAHTTKPSLILAFHVPPDTREVGEDKSSTLATTDLPESRMQAVYTGTANPKSANPVTLNCLFDTGASKCFIGIDTVRKLKLALRPSNLKSVATAAGKAVPTLGSVTFPIQLDAIVLEITAHVLPSFLDKIQLIIGEDWMTTHSVTLSYNPSQCTIKAGHGDPVVLQKYKPEIPEPSHSVEKGSQPVDANYPEVDHRNTEISARMAAHILKQQHRNNRRTAFVALIRPHEAVCPGPTGNLLTAKAQAGEAPGDPESQTPRSDVLSDLAIPDLNHITPELRKLLQDLVLEFSDIFSETPLAGGALVDIPEHTIDLIPGSKPAFRRNYRMSPLEQAELKRQVLEFLEKGIITPSNSPFGAPVLFIPKPNGGLRFCLDYRGLNDITVKTRYQLPRIDDLLDTANGASYFSTLDMAGGYFQIKIASEDRAKTAFSTPFGHYEWTVLPMGICNSPSSYMRTMQKIFDEYIGDFMQVYLDDLLIMSKTAESHIDNLRKVFLTLRKHRLQAKFSKCRFLETQVKFLGHILSKDGIQADPAKIKTLVDWQTPTNSAGMLQFLGLANYFRKFIPNFSRLSAPLYHLTKKGVPFLVGEEAQLSFKAIKQLLISPPILAYPDPEKPYELISDASLLGCGAVLTQEGKAIAYFSSRFSPAERNYTTGEQELLGIIKALKEWRCYLEGCNGLTLVTDHNPLTFFSKQPTLSRRQARWSEFLSRFHFEVKYRPGASNPADSLSRLGMECPVAVLAVTVAEFSSDLMTRIKEATLLDPHFTDERSCRKYEHHEEGYWTFQGRIVVPESLQTEIIQEHHSNVISGHFSWNRTLDLISRHFWWPNMRNSIQTFVSQCLSCQRNKASNQRPFGQLTPLDIPDTRWHTVTMDFITDLPRTTGENNSILVVVDKLSKYVHLIPTVKSVTAEETAKLFISHVYQYHGMPRVIISDRDTRFTSGFWRSFCKRLTLDHRYSTAFHPQTDGQTERANRVIEEVIRHFIDGTHKNWEDLLPLIAFAMNNAKSSTTGETPFYLNYGTHPRTPQNLGLPEGKIPSLEVVFQDMHDTLTRIKSLMITAQDRQKSYADARFRQPQKFKPDDLVMLSTKNINFAFGKKKFHPKYLGPFVIDSIIGNHRNAVRLRLPASYKIHPVFHVSLIKPYKAGSSPVPPPIEPEIVDGAPYFKVETILAKRVKSRGRGRKITEYLIKWLGYDESQNSWEPRSNLTDDLKGSIHDPQNLLD